MSSRHAAALLVLLTGLLSGCTLQVKRATHVTASAATLKATLHCGARKHIRAHGRVWWQVRQAGTSAWHRASRKRRFKCGKRRKRIVISKRVTGLRAGVIYEYRLALDPRRRGGRRLYSRVRRFRTAAAPVPRQLVLPQARGFRPGLVGSADPARSALAAGRLGADVVRLEFDVGTPASALRPGIAAVADQGAQVLLLAGFEGRLPTEAEARNVAGWAAEFGPGGSFWKGRPDGHLAVRQIEFGNETSGRHQFDDPDGPGPGDDWWNSRQYLTRAENYAHRFVTARNAMDLALAANGQRAGDVDLLCQADDGGSANRAWVDHMFIAEPGLVSKVGGWVVHPYGPQSRWKPKLDRMIAYTGAHGGGSVPIDATEYGISTNNGVALTDNYGWPVNLTFAQAALHLDDTVSAMRADPAIGPRLRLFMLYSAYDLSAALGPNDRERFFGALGADLADKGAYSAEVRELFGP